MFCFQAKTIPHLHPRRLPVPCPSSVLRVRREIPNLYLVPSSSVMGLSSPSSPPPVHEGLEVLDHLAGADVHALKRNRMQFKKFLPKFICV